MSGVKAYLEYKLEAGEGYGDIGDVCNHGI